MSAVRVAGEFLPDAVVLDWLLPDIDGLEVLQRLRSGDSHVPVLFLVLDEDSHEVVRGCAA